VLDQYVTSNFPTLERLALVRLREQFPGLRRNGFSKAVCSVRDDGRECRLNLLQLNHERRQADLPNGRRPFCPRAKRKPGLGPGYKNEVLLCLTQITTLL
jgi:hypothetical protein